MVAARTEVPLIALGSSGWSEGRSVEVTNPWDGSVTGSLPTMTASDLGQVLDWGGSRANEIAMWPLADRVAELRKWAVSLEENADRIARLETSEMGKTIRQSRPGVRAQADRIRAMCEEALVADRATRDVWRTGRGSGVAQILTRREPMGLAVGFLPFNSPVAALVWKTVPALLMGNPVVIKLSSQAPLAALTAAHLLMECDIPEGAVQVVAGPGTELSQVFATHPAVRKISFTGGSEAGTILWRSAAETMPRLTLECGSNDPALILDDADLDLAARTVVNYGIRFYNGQLCTAPKRCLVAASIYDEFVERVRTEAGNVVAGDPLEEATELGPLVSVQAAEEIRREVQRGLDAGAHAVHGGEILTGALFASTVLRDVDVDNPLFREGPFGPVLSVIPFTNDTDAVRLANNSPYGLRAAIFSGDEERALSIAYGVDYGAVSINGPATVGEPTISVDPRKLSGIGTEGIETSLGEFSQIKLIWHAE
ncbi:MAG: aldehyde dehydrogenase family protein [Actinobacteria bacterium]|nr:aldehyde dehydrogenase family protein [Actinomycetota bacterium]